MLVSGYSSTCRCLWLEITCTYVRLCDDVLNYFIFFLNGKTIFQLFIMDVWMLERNFRGYDFHVETRLSGLSVFVRTFLRTNIFCVLFIWLCITNSCHDFHYFLLYFFIFKIHIFFVFAIRIELQILFFIYFFLN